MRKNIVPIVLCLFAVPAAFLSGCSVANIASVRTSTEVVRQFQDLEINPNYRYWYLNQENSPFGVLGVDREYRFDGGPLWRPVDPDTPTFKKVVGLVQSFPVMGSNVMGFEIMDSQGRQIGVWYSSLTAGISVDSAAKSVSVTTETPWIRPRGMLPLEGRADVAQRAGGYPGALTTVSAWCKPA
jgi:hypothetical protein